MQRYFAKEKLEDKFSLNSDDLYHIKTVMRMKTGDKVEVVYDDSVYLCEIELIKDNVIINLLEKLETESNLEPKIRLILPFLKEQKMDLILQKGTELGIDEFIFIETERTIVKVEDKEEQSKLDRWSRICKEASEQ